VSRRIPGGLALAAIASACALLLFAAGAQAAVAGPDLGGTRAAALIEESTGAQLYGSNATSELAIASTTKLMTALVTLEHVHNLNRLFTQNNFVPAPSDSQVGLVPGERMSVHDLLLAMLLPSADDAAEDLAYNVGGGSVPRFIAMMNTRARQLGLTHTHYSTPSGLDTPGNHSSATDLTKLASYLLNHQPFFRRAVDTTSAVLHTGNHVREVVNLDDLVAKVPWINGVKTGHTLDAGYVLVSSGTQNGMTLIGAVLGTPSEASRDANALALLRWGFATFHIVTPVRGGELLARLNVKDQPSLHAPIIAGASYRTVLARTDHVRIRLHLPKQLKGPMKRGVVVGSARLIAGGRTLDRIPLVLNRALPAVSALTRAARFITRPITLVFLVALLIAALAAIAIVRRERARGRSRVRRKSAHDHHRHAQRRA
jgi:serine-type D-Ala-D-Ala carboxypeptidase (penicillin-binding protein 5/6)